ncbi:MAG: hypothetical protein KKG64_01305 [Firmicutes bacterium]|nr:hypothetical protein [Bacillota bacterium]
MEIVRKHILTSVGEIEFITLKSKDMQVELTSFGAAIYQIYLDQHEMLVGPKDMNTFLESKSYYGKTIGRVSGRLVVPSYQIAGKTYRVAPVGAKKTNLHGGKVGFSFKNFEITDEKVRQDAVSVTMKYVSQNLEEDFPGELTLWVTYTLNDLLELKIDYDAKSDQDTLCNITCHPYFNFQKHKTNIFKHELSVQASQYLNINEDYLILSKDSVENKPFDMRKKIILGERIQQVLKTSFYGFDHTWIFDQNKNQVDLYDPKSNLGLKVDSSYPCIVIYTHNLPAPTQLEQVSHNGIHSSIALECQFEPGGIHHEYLNSAILKKDEKYKQYISYKFYRKESF